MPYLKITSFCQGTWNSCSVIALPLFSSYFLSNDPSSFLLFSLNSGFFFPQWDVFLLPSNKSRVQLSRTLDNELESQEMMHRKKRVAYFASPPLSPNWPVPRRAWHPPGRARANSLGLSFLHAKWGFQIWQPWKQLVYDPIDKYFVPVHSNSMLDI